MLYIGIDCGVHTGLAVWDAKAKSFRAVETLSIHRAIEAVQMWADWCKANGEHLIVIFEDARQRKWLPNGRARAQGAGSVKRDAKIWEDYLQDKKIPFKGVAPQKGLTKWGDEAFSVMTGWKERTSNHARDAALLVYGR